MLLVLIEYKSFEYDVVDSIVGSEEFETFLRRVCFNKPERKSFLRFYSMKICSQSKAQMDEEESWNYHRWSSLTKSWKEVVSKWERFSRRIRWTSHVELRQLNILKCFPSGRKSEKIFGLSHLENLFRIWAKNIEPPNRCLIWLILYEQFVPFQRVQIDNDNLECFSAKVRWKQGRSTKMNRKTLNAEARRSDRLRFYLNLFGRWEFARWNVFNVETTINPIENLLFMSRIEVWGAPEKCFFGIVKIIQLECLHTSEY